MQNNAWYEIDQSEDELCSESLDDEMIEYLTTNGIVIDIPEKFVRNFPKYNTEYSSFPKIESIILDYDKTSNYDFGKALEAFDVLNPQFLQIRYFSSPNLDALERLFNSFKNYTIESVEILIPYNVLLIQKLNRNRIIEITGKIRRVIFHSMDENQTKIKLNSQKALYTTEKIKNNESCGQISYFNFSNNANHVLKSINYNSCLYKKIGVDVHGNLKNCPSLHKILGTVFEQDWIHRLMNFTFPTANIKKDEIEVCKDCQYRYICTDCRAFTDSSSRDSARPSKCNYNPYIAKWSHENDFVSLKDCGVISDENCFSIDKKRINSINKELWGE